MCNNIDVDFYLKITSGERVLVGSISNSAIDETWMSLEQNESEIDDFMQLVSGSTLKPVPDSYREMCKTLNIHGKSALLAIPKEKLKHQLLECYRKLQDALCDTENSEYLVTYLTIKRCLQRLSRASVDKSRLEGLIRNTKHTTVANSLKSFMPLSDGLCEAVSYSMTNSATGRLTVTKGPQILTAPAAVRSCLKSKFKMGKVLQIDVIAAEPKFALQLKGADLPCDVYAHVSANILKGEVDRKQAKLITLCALYGQSAKNLEKQLPADVSARGVIRKTRDYFNYDRLNSRLRTELKQGNFRNAIGRPLKLENDNEHLLISYYLQSSVAEGSILMFSDFIQKFSEYCSPVYVIHDALLVDCQPKFAKSLLEKGNVQLSLGDWKFDAEVKLAGDI